MLGHRYGGTERIEERHREGDEVVVTVRDVKTCERCGEERIVSESTEVTAIPEAAGATDGGPSTDGDAGTDVPETSIDDPGADDAVIMDETAADAGRNPGEWPAEPEPDPDAADEAGHDADTDDAAWPAVDTAADEGYDAVSGPGPDPAEDELIAAARAEPGDETAGEETAAGFVKADDVEAPTARTDSETDTEYYCPQCDWRRESLEASLRAGDICPECRTGYIAERE